MNALCFDILTDSFCRKPLVLIFIQFARGVYPLPFMLLSFNELQNAPAPPTPNRPEPEEFGAPPPTPWSYGCGLYLQPASETGRNLSRMNTYAKHAANPCGMNTSRIIGLKASCNEHLQENGGRGGLIVTHHARHDGFGGERERTGGLPRRTPLVK